MVFNVLLTGVGGEGVLLASALLARAASYDGYKVSGIQLHGLAQRGGAIPTYVRFGKEVHSPTIPRGQADLIIGLETIEVARECYYADKKRTNFLIDTYSIKPVYANLLKQKYPSIKEVRKTIEPFAKDIVIVDASEICEKELGSMIYGNVMTLGVAISAGLLPISKQSMLESIKKTIPRDLNKNLAAFELGF